MEYMKCVVCFSYVFCVDINVTNAALGPGCPNVVVPTIVFVVLLFLLCCYLSCVLFLLLLMLLPLLRFADSTILLRD